MYHCPFLVDLARLLAAAGPVMFLIRFLGLSLSIALMPSPALAGPATATAMPRTGMTSSTRAATHRQAKERGCSADSNASNAASGNLRVTDPDSTGKNFSRRPIISAPVRTRCRLVRSYNSQSGLRRPVRRPLELQLRWPY